MNRFSSQSRSLVNYDQLLAGRPIEGEPTASGDILEYDATTGSWQVLAGGGGGGEVNTGQNVGGGAGQVFRDKTGTVLNFRTIQNIDGTITVSTAGDLITLSANAATDFGDGTDTSQNIYTINTGLAPNNYELYYQSQFLGVPNLNVLSYRGGTAADAGILNLRAPQEADILAYTTSATGNASIGCGWIDNDTSNVSNRQLAAWELDAQTNRLDLLYENSAGTGKLFEFALNTGSPSVNTWFITSNINNINFQNTGSTLFNGNLRAASTIQVGPISQGRILHAGSTFLFENQNSSSTADIRFYVQSSVAQKEALRLENSGSFTRVRIPQISNFLQSLPSHYLSVDPASGLISYTPVPTGGGNNIYNSDGTLTGNRTVTMAGNDLALTGGTVSTTNFEFQNATGNTIIFNGVGNLLADRVGINPAAVQTNDFFIERDQINNVAQIYTLDPGGNPVDINLGCGLTAGFPIPGITLRYNGLRTRVLLPNVTRNDTGLVLSLDTANDNEVRFRTVASIQPIVEVINDDNINTNFPNYNFNWSGAPGRLFMTVSCTGVSSSGSIMRLEPIVNGTNIASTYGQRLRISSRNAFEMYTFPTRTFELDPAILLVGGGNVVSFAVSGTLVDSLDLGLKFEEYIT